MKSLIVLSATEQVAAYLRELLVRGDLRGEMPGVNPLALELGVNHKTVKSALDMLEAEGLLTSQGRGRQRRITEISGGKTARTLRIGILTSELADRKLDYMVDLQHQLLEAGHSPFYPPRSLLELNMDVGRIARLVTENPADAWVVVSGSNAVLEWFSRAPVKVFALFGRRRGLPIAGGGPDKPPAMAEATRTLVSLGHRRIVLLTRKTRRLPKPGATEQAFLDQLQAEGITPSPYNLPDWEMTVDGFYQCLNALFQFTRPTALIIDEAPFYVAVQQFLTTRRLRVPQDISLVCTDPDPVFAWCKSPVAHIHWDSTPLVNRILTWADNVSRGKVDRSQTLIPALFTAGGTIGQAKPS